MVNQKMEEKQHAAGKGISREHEASMRFFCPVCGKLLHEDNLVDLKSVVEDNLYFVDDVLIVGCTVRLHCEFEHRFDEKEISIDEPHKLVAVVDAEFDESGKCVHFEIGKILPG